MPGNNTSQLGYLMELFSVSVAEMSKYLNVERTTVSKWKTGARTLSEGSQYYKEVIQFLSQKSTFVRKNKINNFFKYLYTDIDCTQNNFIERCIERFLSGAEGPGTAIQSKYLIYDVKNALYRATFSVYSGLEGRKNAMEMVLGVAEDYNDPLNLVIFECDQFSWLRSDNAFLSYFCDRLTKLLKKGDSIELILTAESICSNRALSLGFITNLMIYKNLKLYISNEPSKGYADACIYAIREHFCVLSCKSSNGYSQQYYTSIFNDVLTVNQLMVFFDNIKNNAKSIIASDSRNYIHSICELIIESENKKEPLYIFANMLSVFHMSDELLEDVLLGNKFPASEREAFRKLFNSMRTNILLNATYTSCMFIYFIEEIVDCLKKDKSVHSELSMLLGVPIFMTREQCVRHFQDAARFLVENPLIKISLNHTRPTHISLGCYWIMKNIWGLIIGKDAANRKIVFLDTPNMTQIYTQHFDMIWNMTAEEYKNNQSIYELFHKIAEGSY